MKKLIYILFISKINSMLNEKNSERKNHFQVDYDISLYDKIIPKDAHIEDIPKILESFVLYYKQKIIFEIIEIYYLYQKKIFTINNTNIPKDLINSCDKIFKIITKNGEKKLKMELIKNEVLLNIKKTIINSIKNPEFINLIEELIKILEILKIEINLPIFKFKLYQIEKLSEINLTKLINKEEINFSKIYIFFFYSLKLIQFKISVELLIKDTLNINFTNNLNEDLAKIKQLGLKVIDFIIQAAKHINQPISKDFSNHYINSIQNLNESKLTISCSIIRILNEFVANI